MFMRIKHLKNYMIWMIAVIMLIPVPISAADDSIGACGPDIVWELSSEGVLTLTGTGDMYDYEMGGSPFYGRDDIIRVQIGNGITSVGTYAFRDCRKIDKVMLPEGLKQIDNGAFSGCSSLESMYIPNSVYQLGPFAFSRSSMNEIVVPKSVGKIESGTFSGATDLETVTISADIKGIEPNAFVGCGSIQDIRYFGTEEQWRSVFGTDRLPTGSSIEYLYDPDLVRKKMEYLEQYITDNASGGCFTVSGNSCKNSMCDECKAKNVVSEAEWIRNMDDLPDPDYFSMYHYYPDGQKHGTGYSCCGFANFVGWYIFSYNKTGEVEYETVATGKFTTEFIRENAKPGDIIRCRDHSSVFYGMDGENVIVLDANFRMTRHDKNNQVAFHSISKYSKGRTCVINRVVF